MRGLNANQVKKIIKEKIETNPDLKYYVNNKYLDELIDLIIEGVGEAIEENNTKFYDDLMG